MLGKEITRITEPLTLTCTKDLAYCYNLQEEKTVNEQEAEADHPHHLPALHLLPPHRPLLQGLHPAVHHLVVTPALVAQVS